MHAEPNDVAVLRTIADRLVRLADDAADRRLVVSETDHMGFMTVCMVNKQKEHLRSICILVDNTDHRDAALIARSMLEGLVRLFWATHKPDERRAWRWRAFAWIQDWRLLQRHDRDGRPVDSAMRSQIETNAQEVGDLFYAKAARDAAAAGRPLPDDPFQTSWTSANLETMMRAVEGSPLYGLYRLTSDWAHSNIGGVGRAIHREENRFDYDYADPGMAMIALALGIQALIESLQFLNERFDLDLKDSLDALQTEYIEHFAQWEPMSEDMVIP